MNTTTAARTPALALAAALAASLLAGCAGGATRPAASGETAGDPAEILKTRAAQRWELLIAGKFADAWEFFTPGFRSTTPRDTWAANMSGRPVRWKKAEVKAVDCPTGESYCDVSIAVDIEAQSALPQVGTLRTTAPITERWLSVGGGWYFVPKEIARPQ